MGDDNTYLKWFVEGLEEIDNVDTVSSLIKYTS